MKCCGVFFCLFVSLFWDLCVCVHTLDFSFWGLCSLPPTRVVAWFVPWKKALKNSKEYHIPKTPLAGKKLPKKAILLI